MSTRQIELSDKALKQLKKIAKSDRQSAERIISKIEDYANNPIGNFDIKVLKGYNKERKRLRVGDYRIIFKVENKVIKISLIKHRQEAYND